MHTKEHALKKETPIYDFFPVGESHLYWYHSDKVTKLNDLMEKRPSASYHCMIGLHECYTCNFSPNFYP